MRILHVEDDDTFRKWVKQGLKESGFAVDGACNAKEAMQMASENLYDVILLGHWHAGPERSVGAADTTTSWKYGRDFHYFWKFEEQLKLDAFEGGADDYMVKPILVSELKARIHRWLQRRNQFVSSEAPSSLAGRAHSCEGRRR